MCFLKKIFSNKINLFWATTLFLQCVCVHLLKSVHLPIELRGNVCQIGCHSQIEINAKMSENGIFASTTCVMQFLTDELMNKQTDGHLVQEKENEWRDRWKKVEQIDE